MKTWLVTTWTMICALKDEYKRRVRENRKTLIEGSVLDPENHPSYKR
jgi:hypothetical protein